MKVVNQVLSTTDYSIFKTLNGNRIINKSHLLRLKQSLAENQLMSVAIVNENYEIIDGQHRYRACKDLNKPFYFIIMNGYSLKEVQKLNTNMSNWSKKDYLNAFCDLQYPEYLKFRDFLNEFSDFSFGVVELLLRGNSSTAKSKQTEELKSNHNKQGKYFVGDFQNGEFKIFDIELARLVANQCMDIKHIYEGYNRRSYVGAILALNRNTSFNHDEWLNKLNMQKNSLVDCTNISQYKLLIEEIYNYRRVNKVNLRY